MSSCNTLREPLNQKVMEKSKNPKTHRAPQVSKLAE